MFGLLSIHNTFVCWHIIIMSYMLTDVDECVLQTDVCNEYASCQNIDGTFNCTCDEGYEGNGRTRCDGMLFSSIPFDPTYQ